MLVAEVDNKIVGVLNFSGNSLKRYRHQGKLAIFRYNINGIFRYLI